MRVAVFSVKPYDRAFLDHANAGRHALTFYEARLSVETALRSAGADLKAARGAGANDQALAAPRAWGVEREVVLRGAERLVLGERSGLERPETYHPYGALVGSLTRIVEDTVQGFYARRARQEGHLGGKTGSVTVVQRTSSDLRLNPHLHAVLDGTWHEQEGELFFRGLGHLRTSEVGARPRRGRRTSSSSSSRSIHGKFTTPPKNS